MFVFFHEKFDHTAAQQLVLNVLEPLLLLLNGAKFELVVLDMGLIQGGLLQSRESQNLAGVCCTEGAAEECQNSFFFFLRKLQAIVET